MASHQCKYQIEPFRVLLYKDHPHSGKMGYVLGADETAIGIMCYVKFEDGGGSCYARPSDFCAMDISTAEAKRRFEQAIP